MTLVVDASVALKWFVDEDGSPGAVSLLNSAEPLIPPIWWSPKSCSRSARSTTNPYR